jgi:hypothetical protein
MDQGHARFWPSLRQAPLNPCGSAVQRPEGIAQRRERDAGQGGVTEAAERGNAKPGRAG